MLEVLATIWGSPGTGVHRPHISESPTEKGRSCFLVTHFHCSLNKREPLCRMESLRKKYQSGFGKQGDAEDISRDGTLTVVGIGLLRPCWVSLGMPTLP